MRRPSRGFTFIEILITLTIISIAVVPLLRMFAVAVEQVGVTDDLRTALDLAREEIEKVKNLALTEQQIKQMGSVINPPVQLNRSVWFTVRVIDPAASPLEVQVFVFRGGLEGTPLVSLVTIINK